MQQAARVSDFTAFLYEGSLIEFGPTAGIFTKPQREADRGLHHRPVRLKRRKTDGSPSAERDRKAEENDRSLRRLVEEAWGTPSARSRTRTPSWPGRSWRRIPGRPAEVDVEEECLKILALHQPVAVDLRFIVAVLKINNDLERIGDLAVNIAERPPSPR